MTHSTKKKIGIFGGSFDPIHFGHINLAIQLKEIHHLDEILFFPAYCSPHKMPEPPKAAPEQRLQMVRLAIKNIPGFHASDLEIQKEGPSYTIDTLRLIQAEPHRIQTEASDHSLFRLLLSEEALYHFEEWKEAEELVKLAPPLIGCREGFGKRQMAKMPKNFLQIFMQGITKTRVMEISSTEIRERLKNGLYCGHLLDAAVLDYIYSHRLYSTQEK